ncbi:MAG: hypothetical protein AAF267_16420 [Deinococcota bacterium]
MNISLDADLVARIDDILHRSESHDAFFYQAIIRLIKQREQELYQEPNKKLRDARGLELINQESDYLNREAALNMSLVSSLFEDL